MRSDNVSIRAVGLRWIAAAAMAVCMAAPAHAQSEAYPSRPIRMIVPAGPGSSPDLLARTIAKYLAPRLGQQVLVVNQPGGGGNIGHTAAAKAPPDGYTLLVTSDQLSINDTLFPNLPFKSTDFVPVSQAIESPQILVINSNLPFNDVRGLIAYAKANPGKLNFGSPQMGTLGHLTGELMKMAENIEIVHIPFQGAPLAVKDVIAGNTELLWVTLPAVIGQVQQGAVRGIAVSSAQRAPSVPSVPTMRELGYAAYDFTSWQGVLLPPGTPQPIAIRLNAEISAVLKDPEASNALSRIGFEPVGGSPERFAKVIADTSTRWGKVIRDAGVKPN